MRWYWMLLLMAVTAMIATSPDAEKMVRTLVPSTSIPAAALILLALAVLCAFTALIIGSRTFGWLALVSVMGAVWLQPIYWVPFWRSLDRWTSGQSVSVDRMLAQLLHSGGHLSPGELQWLAPLAFCALLMVGALTLGTKTE
jgi:hypothetical protein